MCLAFRIVNFKTFLRFGLFVHGCVAAGVGSMTEQLIHNDAQLLAWCGQGFREAGRYERGMWNGRRSKRMVRMSEC